MAKQMGVQQHGEQGRVRRKQEVLIADPKRKIRTDHTEEIFGPNLEERWVVGPDSPVLPGHAPLGCVP
jgi:hypothetical protein